STRTRKVNTDTTQWSDHRETKYDPRSPRPPGSSSHSEASECLVGESVSLRRRSRDRSLAVHVFCMNLGTNNEQTTCGTGRRMPIAGDAIRVDRSSFIAAQVFP